MSAEQIFNLAFPLAVPFWALMILLPGWRWTKRIIGSPWIVAVPLIAYVVALVPQFVDFFAAVAQPSFDGVRELFSSELGTAAIWAHLIAFDLFIGRWMYLDARERGIHPLMMAPILIITILLSPIGLLGYLVVRSVRGGRRREPAAVAAADDLS